MTQSNSSHSRRPHPVVLAAAASVITFSLLGIGAITGLIPSAYSSNAGESPKVLTADDRSVAGKDVLRRPVIQPLCSNCGVVDSIRSVQLEGKASGLGAVAGGVTGAVVGNQVGNGHGREAMTVLTSVGGAFVGHSIEKKINGHTAYRVTVRMDDGSFRTVSQSHPPAVGVGSKVRVSSGSLVELS